MAAILKQLHDDDLEAIRHMIRRDAQGDLAIALEAELRGQRTVGKSFRLGATDKAKEAVIYRERRGPGYRRWLRRIEDQAFEILEQEKKFELLANLVKDPSSGGMTAISKSVQARLLVLAMKANDEDLLEGAAKNGWIRGVIKASQDQEKIEQRKKADKLKAQLEGMAKGGGKAMDIKAVCDKVDEVMGLKKGA